jgi:hypothetical protein
MAFVYKRRAPEVVQQRAAGGNADFKGFVHNEYNMYTPHDGDNWIRILPPTWDDAKHYGFDIHLHFGVGPERAVVLCNAKMNGTHCPICQAQNRAQKAGDDELAKELRVTNRVLVWLIDRKTPEKGVMWWGMPYGVDRDICNISTDRMSGEYYEIDHPEAGYDVMFSKNGKGILTKYTGFQLARKASSVDPASLAYISENPLPGILLERDYAEVQALFGGAPTTDAPATEAHQPAAAARRPMNTQQQAEPAEDDNIPWERIDPNTGEVTSGTVRETSQQRVAPAAPARRPMNSQTAHTSAPAAEAAPAGLSPAQQRAAALRARLGK